MRVCQGAWAACSPAPWYPMYEWRTSFGQSELLTCHASVVDTVQQSVHCQPKRCLLRLHCEKHQKNLEWCTRHDMFQNSHVQAVLYRHTVRPLTSNSRACPRSSNMTPERLSRASHGAGCFTSGPTGACCTSVESRTAHSMSGERTCQAFLISHHLSCRRCSSGLPARLK